MTFQFEVKTTGELTPAEISQHVRLFREVYGKPCPEDLFMRKYARTCLGRSVHSLMFLDGDLVGAFSAIPVRYRFFGQTLLFATAVDLMISPRHRGSIRRLHTLAEGLYAALAREGVTFVFSCLRDEMFQTHSAVSGWRAAGRIHYYVAPFRLPWLGPATTLLRGGLRLWNRFSPAPAVSGDPAFGIEKVNDEAFAGYRYQVFPTGYEERSSADRQRRLCDGHPVAGIPQTSSWVCSSTSAL